MSPLRLFEKFGDVILRASVQSFALKKLSVAENRGKRIVEFVSDAGNQLADGRHFFALQKLFLSLAQIFVSAASLFVEPNFFDGGSQLAADGYEQIFVVARIFISQLIAQAHDSHGTVLAPEQNPDPGPV